MMVWWRLVLHALWVTGLAVLLATFSYHNWVDTCLEREAQTQMANDIRPFYVLGGCLLALGILMVSVTA